METLESLLKVGPWVLKSGYQFEFAGGQTSSVPIPSNKDAVWHACNNSPDAMCLELQRQLHEGQTTQESEKMIAETCLPKPTATTAVASSSARFARRKKGCTL